MLKSWYKWICLCLVGVLLLSGVGCAGDDQEEVVIASINTAETQILGEMIKQLLEDNLDITVDHKRNFQGSSATQQALETGDVQMYNSYTGTQFTGVLGMEATEEWKDQDKVFEYVKDQYHEQYGVKVLEPYGFNNTYIIALRQETLDELGIEKTSELVSYAPEMSIATDPTFIERKGDGWNEFAETYGLDFKEVVGMSYDLMYQALKNKEVDAAVAYSTDGRIVAFDLVTLEDNKNFFPPYDCALFIKEDFLEKYPEIEEIVAPLIGTIDEAVMSDLNAQVDSEQKDPEDVARTFLEERELI